MTSATYSDLATLASRVNSDAIALLEALYHSHPELRSSDEVEFGRWNQTDIKVIDDNGMSHDHLGRFDGGSGGFGLQHYHFPPRGLLPGAGNSPLGFIQVRAAAIDHLRKDHARPGAVEAGYLIKRANGEVVQFGTGNATSYGFDQKKLDSHAFLCALHSHPEDALFSPDDWQVFIEQPSIREFSVVTPHFVFTLTKPDGWEPNYQWRKNPYEDYEDHKEIVSVERGFSTGRLPTPAQWTDILVESNYRMARQYGIHFSIQE